MSVISYDVPINAQRMTIGVQGENNVREFLFDVTEWRQLTGNIGAAEMVVQRVGDSSPYATVITMKDENTVSWVPTSVDTAKVGAGKIQLMWFAGTQIVKTKIFDMKVDPALDYKVPDDSLDPWASWMPGIINADANYKGLTSRVDDLQQRQTSPYNFKGAVATMAALPSSGNKVNDTYYVEAVKYRVTWTGSAWQQSSMDESDYEDELANVQRDLDARSGSVNDRFVLSETPLGCGFERAVIIGTLTFGYVSGSNGSITYYSTTKYTDIIPVDKATDAVFFRGDLSDHKISICMYQDGVWVHNTGWYSPTEDTTVRMSTLGYEFNGIRIQYAYKVERTLTDADDIDFRAAVSVRRGSNSFIADFDKLKTDSLAYVSAVAPVSEAAERLLANITDNMALNATSTFFDDTPTGAGGTFINLRYSSNYKEQLFIESNSGARFERIVSMTGEVYRDWTLDTRTRFLGKKVYCTGDSIMWGRTDADGRASVTVPQAIAARYPVTVTNAAVGGDTVSHRSDGASVYDRITKVNLSGYDYVVINGGTNDYGYGAALGDPDSTDVSTFYGAYKAILDYVFAQNPYMRVLLITPTFRNYVARDGAWHYGDGYEMPGDGGYTLAEMTEAIHKIGRMYHVPVFDSSENSVPNHINYAQTLELTAESSDRYLHLSDESYRLYGDAIASAFGGMF